MSGIKDKIVVITGASSGIGEATARMLADRGAKVVLGATGPDRLKAVADRIVKTGGEAAYAKTDVRRRDDVTNLVNLACERYGKLDVLVNNAGIGADLATRRPTRRRVGGHDRHQHQRRPLRHRGSAACLPQAGFRAFRQHRFTAGLKTVPNQAVYSATKFAVRAISEGMRQEAGDRLRVTIISPGFVKPKKRSFDVGLRPRI
jgi:NADP-dependent 3-hydroxy acid dehydrogenase YdfG